MTIPLYLFVLYRAEFHIRRYRPQYSDKATIDDFSIMKTKDITKEGGSFCFAQNDGNVYQWLWLELIAFQAQIACMIVYLLKEYFSDKVV